jgi:predicted  nucleic acid-binding Zn-ribbon protein
MRELLLVLVPTLVTAVATRLLTRRKYRLESDGCELSNLKAEMALYKQLLDDTKAYLVEARSEVTELTSKVVELNMRVDELNKINVKLDKECKELRKLLSQQNQH